DILGPLFDLVKSLGGEALVRDNSGSGEAYGGLLNEHAEYYDYHFYCDLPFYPGLIDEVSPRLRPQQPRLFGAICDADTCRDLRRLDHRPPTTDHRPPTTETEPDTETPRHGDTEDDRLLSLSPGLPLSLSPGLPLLQSSVVGRRSSVVGRPWWTLDEPD